ncbi:MAG TPA: DUF4402 domain-containing protein [Sphingomicrobium sp.]|jgi:hypothetical protein|nr:DUF4402 domain-containing protein [Sphingomicrobium sp.]
MRGRFALIATALGWAVIAAAPDVAAAQCRLCETPSIERESAEAGQPVSLQVEAMLDFDQLILMASGDGVATLLPDGTRSVSGSLGGFSGRAMVGSVSIRGEPGRAVRVDMPRRIELRSRGGGRIAIDRLTTDLPAGARLDSAGRLIFRFGGRLQVSGDAEGDYRGDLPITVEYL